MSWALRQINRLRGTALARWLQKLPPAVRLFQASRAVLVRERLRFALATLLRRPGTRVYTLRESGAKLALRHDVGDVVVVDEIFWWGFYDPPPEVARRLAAHGGDLSIADLGANIGAFGVWCLPRWPGARIVAVEADPDNAAVCARAIAANGAGERWRLIEACAGSEDGTALFAAGNNAQSHVVDELGAGVVALPQIDAFELISACQLVKIDIESSEWPLLADPRMASLQADAILLEYHPAGAPTGSPHEDARRLLAQAGYTEMVVEEMPDSHGIAWAWRAPAPDPA